MKIRIFKKNGNGMNDIVDLSFCEVGLCAINVLKTEQIRLTWLILTS